MLSSLASNRPDQVGTGDEEMKYENKTKEEIGYEEMMEEFEMTKEEVNAYLNRKKLHYLDADNEVV